MTRQLDALRAERFDLRITGLDGRKTYLRGLSSRQIEQRQPALATAARRGYRVELRAQDPHLHLLRNVDSSALRVAARAGFEPAVVVEVTPGRYDVWLRHAPASPAQVPSLRRAASLAFDRPTTARPSLFGSLAGVSQDRERVARLASRRAQPYSRAQDLSQLLQPSPPQLSRSPAHLELDRFNVKTPVELRRQQPRLTPRQADRLWADQALRAGLSPETTFRTLAAHGARRNAHPLTRARYAARVLSQPRLSPAPTLARPAIERIAATVLSLPLKVVRLTLFVVNVAQRLVRHL